MQNHQEIYGIYIYTLLLTVSGWHEVVGKTMTCLLINTQRVNVLRIYITTQSHNY